ncbi:MAG: imidazole glycerol phosphate synthase subunit HisH [Candidatus Omnitrophota bacterium]
MIVIVDYGMGNLRSIQKAVEAVGGGAIVSSKPGDIARATKIILPGVGAFGDAMKELKKLRLIKPLKKAVASGAPFLGLCLGLQLLFERSEEAPGVRGLGIIKGSVKKFPFGKKLRRDLKVPHMGWNTVQVASCQLPVASKKNKKNKKKNSDLLKGVPKNAHMYFVHSYYVTPKDNAIIYLTTEYGFRFVSGIQKDNVYAFQFHPEKSQKNGLRILRNFVAVH